MRKLYLFVLSMVFTTLSVFAQFTNNPKVVSEFNPSADSWVKVCFVDNKGQTRFMTAYSQYFKGEDEKAGDSADQLFQLVGADLNNFQLVSKTGSYLYADLSNNYINASSTPNTGAYNVCLVSTGKNPIKAYQGVAPKILKISDAKLYPGPQYWEYSGYINGFTTSSDTGVVFKVVGGDVPPSDPAEGGGEDPEEKTFKLTKSVVGNGTFKICKRGTTDEIADLTKVAEGTEIDIICSPSAGHILKQINGGELFGNAFGEGIVVDGNGLVYSPSVAVTKNTTITVTFAEKVVEKKKFMLLRAYGSNPQGGTFKVYNAADNQEIPEGEKVEEGTTLYVKAIPEDGYILKQVNIFGVTTSQGDIFQESQFDPKTGFALTVNGINPINQNTRITVTFVQKEEEEKPEEEVKNDEGFTNAPSVVPAFDPNATKWYKIYFVNGDKLDQSKVLTTRGNNDGLRAEANSENNDNQLWQLVGTSRNDFQLVSKSGIYVTSKVSPVSISIDGTTTAKTDKYQLKLITPNASDLKMYNGVPTKLLKFIDRNYSDIICPSYGGIEYDAWIDPTNKGANGGTVVVFKQIGEDVKPVEKVSVTIQREAYKGDVSIVGVTEQPTVSTDQEMTWILESGKEYTLDIQAKKGWEFSHIYDNRYANLEEKTFTASKENTRVEVHFKEKKYSVKLNSTFDGGRVDVTNAYVEKLPLGFNVQLSVTPDAGYELESLTVGGKDITTTKSFDVDEDNTIVAVFKKKTTGTLKTLTNEGGSVTFQGQQDGAEVQLGTEVSLIVTPKEGYELISLKVGGKDVKDSKKFKVGVNNTIEAVFNKKTYTLTAPTTTGGKIAFEDVNAGDKVEYGQTVAITVTPEEGYELASLTAGGKDVKDSKSFTVGDDNTVVATFKKKTYTLTLPAETEQGAVEFEGYNNGDKAEYGTEVPVKVLPKKGYELESITVGGKDVTASKKFTVGENNDIVVKWTEKLYDLVAPKVDGGHIEFLGINEGDKLKIGQKVRIKVVPNKGYTLDKLTAGGKDISSDLILTVDEDNTIELTFRKATAVELLEGISFAVYPNPATEFVKVEGLPANAQVDVISLTGKRVLSAQADFAGSLELNVAHLPKGLYLVRSGKMVVKLQVR